MKKSLQQIANESGVTTLQEIMDRTGLSIDSVRHHIKLGRLKPLLRRATIFSLEEADALIASLGTEIKPGRPRRK